mmetsp:Transcript_17063/g.25234  ORF Transcript_17063/g.25234 Transcript_17063/m.25234 type:complete len:122 (+) Transcript_17063:716-1081(+)
MRNIEEFELVSHQPISAGMLLYQPITFTIRCRSFLNKQVRNMIGSVVEVGAELMSLEDLRNLLDAKDRTLAPPPAPAHGLYLQVLLSMSRYCFFFQQFLYEGSQVSNNGRDCQSCSNLRRK